MTEASQLLARGRPVTLLGGEVVNVRYGMRAMVLLEEEFGTLENLQAVMSAPPPRAILGPIVRILACGLTHEVTGGERMSVAQLIDELIDRLDPERIYEYEQAIIGALVEAFPTVPAEASRPNGSGPRGRAVSPGASTTTSRPSGSAARRRSSGR